MQTFFKRLLYIVDSQGFKNLNDFALNGLKYDSSSKLNRLKDEKNKPSIEILLDIANKFEKVNLHWLVTGKGEPSLEKNGSTVGLVSEPLINYSTDKNDSEVIEILKQTIDDLKRDKEMLYSLLQTKLGKAKTG